MTVFLLLSLISSSENLLTESVPQVTYYIATDGSMNNDGSYDHPFAFSWDSILRKLNSLESGTYVTLIWKEGDYYTTRYGISFSDKSGSRPGHIILKPEDGKRVRIIGGEKIPASCWTRVKGDKYQNRLWRLDYQNDEFTPSAIFINDRRAIFSRTPKFGTIARIRSFNTNDDPNDTNYILRNYEVQPDCIELLESLTPDEIEVARFIFFRGEKQYSESIYKIDKEKGYIITRYLKSEATNLRSGIVGDFYYIENILTCSLSSNEMIQMKNGTILYLAENDQIELNSESSESFAQNPNSYFGFHASKRGDIEIYNFEIINMASNTLYFSYDSNIHFENLIMKHCNEGPKIQECNNVTIQHCLIEDMGTRLLYLSKCDNVLINDSILKTGGLVVPASQGIWLVSGNNNTVISNNEIADTYQSLIQIGGSDGFNMDKLLSIKIVNNHIHHCGKNLFDDMAGITILNHCRGVVLEHNWIHDVYAPRGAGEAICSCTGTAGTIIKNNLVYDANQLSFKMDNGMNVTVENNIFGPGYYGVVGWTNKAPKGTYALDIINNIFIYNTTVLIGDFNKDGLNMMFDKNIYWNTLGPEKVDFRRFTFEQWKEKGFDLNSFIIDPLFVDFENRNFEFKSDDSYKLIGFKPFDLQFGIIGDSKWKLKAKENVGPTRPGEKDYVSKFFFPNLLQMSGFEDFDNNGVEPHSEFWKSQSRLVDQGKCTIEISNEKAFSGSYSLKFGPTNRVLETKRPYIQISLDWVNGKDEFSFKMFTEKTSWFSIYCELSNTIDFKYGKVVINGVDVMDYNCGCWIDVKITIDHDEKFYLLSIDGINSPQFNDPNIEPTETILIQNADTKTPSYFDDISAKSLYVEPILFSICSSSENKPDDTTDASIDSNVYSNTDSNSDNENNENDENNKKMKPGVIAAIVVPIIIVVAAIIIIVIFVYQRKKNRLTSNINENIEDQSSLGM